jgi:hypothetical protein
MPPILFFKKSPMHDMAVGLFVSRGELGWWVDNDDIQM